MYKWINWVWILINVNWLGTTILSANLILHTKWDRKFHVMNLLAKLHFQVFETSWGLGTAMRVRGRPLEAMLSQHCLWVFITASSQGALLPNHCCPALSWNQDTRIWYSTAAWGVLTLYLWTHLLNLKMRRLVQRWQNRGFLRFFAFSWLPI